MLTTWLKTSVVWNPSSRMSAWGHLILRVSAGLMIFYIHGWHKLEGGIAYLQHGTSLKLVEEVAGVRFPEPVLSAFAATAIQFIAAEQLWMQPLRRGASAAMDGGKRGRHRFVVVMSSFL